MLTCREITERATAYAEGHLPEAERHPFVMHLAACRGCADWVRQLEAASRAVGALPEPALPPALQADLEARFEAWARGQDRAARARPAAGRVAWRPAAAAVAAFALAAGLARHPSDRPIDWITALALAAVAAALAARWRQVTLGFAAAAASAAVLAAVLTGDRGGLDGAGGAECLLIVLGVAAGTTAAAWGVLRREGGGRLGPAMGAWAAAGALSAVAALQVACRAHASLPHLLVFHVGGLLLVVAAAAAAARLAGGLARP